MCSRIKTTKWAVKVEQMSAALHNLFLMEMMSYHIYMTWSHFNAYCIWRRTCLLPSCGLKLWKYWLTEIKCQIYRGRSFLLGWWIIKRNCWVPRTRITGLHRRVLPLVLKKLLCSIYHCMQSTFWQRHWNVGLFGLGFFRYRLSFWRLSKF